jgi:hypothetical protein
MKTDLKSFSLQLEGFAKAAEDAMTNTMREIVVEVGSCLIKFSPVLTGRFKGNWQMTVGVPSAQSLVTPDEDGAETLARLKAIAATLSPGEVGWIVNNLTYGKNVEFTGWNKTPAYQPVKRALSEFDVLAAEAIARNRVG